MLLSVRGDDTTVLLASFELEQVLEEIPMGQPRPKVRYGAVHANETQLLRSIGVFLVGGLID